MGWPHRKDWLEGWSGPGRIPEIKTLSPLMQVQEKQKDAQQKGANPLKGASAMPVDDVDDIISQVFHEL